MADNNTVVVINGRNIEVESDGTILVLLGAGPYAGAYRVKLEEATAVEISAAKTIDDNESNNVTKSEDADNDTDSEEVVDEHYFPSEDKYINGINYLVNMIQNNPDDFLNLSAACIDSMYPKFLNPAIAGLNARDCEKDAVYELAKFISNESLRNVVIDIVFSEIDTKTKSDILSFLVNAKMAMNDSNIESIMKMIEKYLSVVTTIVFTNNAQSK